MVYTVTLNPSLDYVVRMKNFAEGKLNRTEEEIIYPGGKGINVSVVLRRLSIHTCALGIAAGFTGGQIIKLLEDLDVESDFVFLNTGMSRINMKIRTEQETEINGRGPHISENDLERLTEKLKKIGPEDALVLSGSLPPTLSVDTYKAILDSVSKKTAFTVVDTSGKALEKSLCCHPFLIKPNSDELAEITGEKLESDEKIIDAATALQKQGARNILVSLAGDGAILITEGGAVLKEKCPRGKVINSVGAGDSMVAGFLAGYFKYKNYEMAFKYGIAAGSAGAFSEHLPTKAHIDTLAKEVLL